MPSHEAPLLVAMITGDLSRRLEGRPNKAVVAHVLGILRLMYGESTVPAPINTKVCVSPRCGPSFRVVNAGQFRKCCRLCVQPQVTSWGTDPFSLMSYSYLKAGSGYALAA